MGKCAAPYFLWDTAEIQWRIYENQFPSSCEHRRFTRISDAWCYGQGSMMSIAAMHLAGSIDRNETVIYPDKWDCHGTDGPECTGTPTPECYFLPLSNCTADAARISQNVYNDLGEVAHVPTYLKRLLNGSIVDPAFYKFFWGEYAMAFFTRPNSRTIGHMERLFRNAGFFDLWNTTGFDIAVHIRHGDKAREMQEVPTVHYANVVRLVRRLVGRNVSVFLATDDPSAVAFFQRLDGIEFYTIERPLGGAYFSMVYYLADIWASAKSTYTIGTDLSNVDRWIRALIDVGVGRASNVFFEVTNRSCISTVHCRT
jgi:hypothetical protein